MCLRAGTMTRWVFSDAGYILRLFYILRLLPPVARTELRDYLLGLHSAAPIMDYANPAYVLLSAESNRSDVKLVADVASALRFLQGVSSLGVGLAEADSLVGNVVRQWSTLQKGTVLAADIGQRRFASLGVLPLLRVLLPSSAILGPPLR